MSALLASGGSQRRGRVAVILVLAVLLWRSDAAATEDWSPGAYVCMYCLSSLHFPSIRCYERVLRCTTLGSVGGIFLQSLLVWILVRLSLIHNSDMHHLVIGEELRHCSLSSNLNLI